jgi:polyferredoxin
MAAQAAIIKQRAKGWRALVNVQTFRHLSQIFFVAFIAYTAIYHVMVGEDSGIITASAEAYCPFGGFETLYRYISSGGKFIPHAHLSNLVVFVAMLASVVLFRSAFCGWVCPFGAFQEGIMATSKWLQKHVPGLKKGMKALQKKAAPLPLARIDRYLRYFKYVVLAWIVWGTITYGVMVFRDVDPYIALINLLEASIGLGTLALAIVFVASFFVERPFCRYACPLGAINGIVSQISPVRLERNAMLCKGCAICDKACPVALPVATANKITSPECIGCLECVEACPRGGALELKLGLPFGR